MKTSVVFAILFIVSSLILVLGAMMKMMHHVSADTLLKVGLILQAISVVWIAVFFIKRMVERNKLW
jgi:hypothetical protein